VVLADARPEYVNFSGLNGTSLSALRIFDEQWPQRTPVSVSVYYSSANTTSLDPSQYTSLGTTALAVNNDSYAIPSSNPSDIVYNGAVSHYADVPVAIPTGTHSILVGLSCANPAYGGAAPGTMPPARRLAKSKPLITWFPNRRRLCCWPAAQ
jgi:hypothetical protein